MRALRPTLPLRLLGPVATVIVVVALELAARFGVAVPHPPLFHVVAVAGAAAVGGLAPGLTSAAVVVLYAWANAPREGADERLAVTVTAPLAAVVAARRRRTAASEDDSDQRFHALVDSAPVMVRIAGVDAKSTFFNKPWLDFTGRSMAEQLGDGWMEGVHTEDLPRCLDVYLTSFQARRAVTLEYRLRRADGEYRWVLDSGAPLHDAAGSFSGFIGSCVDITDRKRAEEQRADLLLRAQTARAEAEAASRIKDEFLATLSHELRTPLNAIVGWARMLTAGGMDEATVRRGIAAIDRNARAQTQLIEDLLDVSRLLTGQLRVDMQPVVLATVVDRVLGTVQPAAQARSVRVDAVIDRTLPPVSGDAQRLQQIVFNLVSNAIKFTPVGGTVEVRLQRHVGSARLVVTDSGKGIEPGFLPYIFERFRQGESTARNYGGGGIGLAIVRHLVELHGGSVRAANRHPAEGAVFTVDLPLSSAGRAGEVADAPDASPLGRLPRLGNVHVLVVDDDIDTLEMVTMVLRHSGAEVTAAGSVAEALTLLQRKPPDVLVSDIGMPGEDGIDLIRRVRGLPAGSGGRVPAIALTAYVRPEDRERVLAAGYQTHVGKPVEPMRLCALIASLAGRGGPGAAASAC